MDLQKSKPVDDCPSHADSRTPISTGRRLLPNDGSLFATDLPGMQGRKAASSPPEKRNPPVQPEHPAHHGAQQPDRRAPGLSLPRHKQCIGRAKHRQRYSVRPMCSHSAESQTRRPQRCRWGLLPVKPEICEMQRSSETVSQTAPYSAAAACTGSGAVQRRTGLRAASVSSRRRRGVCTGA